MLRISAAIRRCSHRARSPATRPHRPASPVGHDLRAGSGGPRCCAAPPGSRRSERPQVGDSPALVRPGMLRRAKKARSFDLVQVSPTFRLALKDACCILLLRDEASDGASPDGDSPRTGQVSRTENEYETK